MREALARIENDFVLSEPRRKGTKQNGLSGFFTKPKHAAEFAAKYINLIIGAAFAALLVTVLVNALAWQKIRHPAPLFGHSIAIEPKAERKTVETIIEAPAPVARPVQQIASEPVAAPDHPANTPHGRDPMAEAADLQSQKTPAPPRDPIAQLLRPSAPAPAAPSKSVLAAQRALMKLGFVVKPDGFMRPATRRALVQFERAHNLPAHGTLSPQVMHELGAESGLKVE